ncbi:pneumococcal serine-rich repeat protein [Eurosta solidaginis]|uniref:pneumococcal serine-rich repeat protein n=1 Tax=Eurosta solidaginis TaxID=178769 RepID=UPI003530A16D
MPRYAAKKLINDEVCLPIQITKTRAITVTETIIVKSSLSDFQSNTPPTTVKTTRTQQKNLQQQLETKQLINQKPQKTTRRQRRKRRRRPKPKKPSTACSNKAGCVTNALHATILTTATTSEATAFKKPIKSRPKKRYIPPYFSTLYPIVIETCLEAEIQPSCNANSKAAAAATTTTTTTSGTDSSSVVVAGALATTRQSVEASAGGCRRSSRRRRRSVTHFTKRKHSAAAKATAAKSSAAAKKAQVKSKETVARLATLRSRDRTKECGKDKKKFKVVVNSGVSSELHVKRHSAWYNFDELLLNKIEPLEVEVKKGGTKRKRDSSVAAARKRNSITHKHTPPPTVLLAPPNFDFPVLYGATVPTAEIIATPIIVAPPVVETVVNAYQSEYALSVETVELTGDATTKNAAAVAATKTTTIKKGLVGTTTPSLIGGGSSSGGNCKKRARGGMSLYERRYQTADAEGRGGSAAVVTNGYLSSTRTSSASSSAVHSDVDNTQDITQQYYMPGTTGSSSALAGSSSSGSGGVIAGTQLGNGSTLNHAPSMATLCNIGNTCYLNSVVYTLRFAPQFLHNLHHLIVDLSSIQQCIARQRAAKSSSLGRGISAVQLENARSWSSKDLAALEQNALMSAGGGVGGCGGGGIGQKSSHQMLTERLHELYQCLHRNELAESTEPFHADTLLHAVQDVNAIFEGNQQQDAHEFLMCLLNSIRETCQLLIKAIGEYPDLIMNGYIRNPDELDAYTFDRDALSSTTSNTSASSNALGGSVGVLSAQPTNSSSSSLSTSNITKASFFSRKSKRKEESKNTKNSRLQSPLKDGQSGGLQATSNSLFYLNSVDLSGATSTTSTATSNASVSSPSATTKGVAVNATTTESNSELSTPVSVLKDKERLAEKIRELGLDFFSEDFEGVTVSTTKCLSCETITEQKESMIDIAVPVPISGFDNADFIDKASSFIQNSCVTREFFRGENKYRCEQCTGYTEAIRSISYEVLPRLLVIQLSRFSGGMEKINSYIPTSFTLQCFCAKCCELSDANKLHIYKLYSVITHVGATMSVGHYIAYTSSLEWANEYVNCPKDRRNASSNSGSQPLGGVQVNGISNSSIYPLGGSGGGGAGSEASGGGSTPNDRSSPGAQAASAASAAASVLASSGSSLMKKMKFGRSKATSSGDMSKNVKNLNGITSKSITNGIGKLSMNTTCHSLNCCATRMCSIQQQQQQQLSASNNELNEEALQNGLNHVPAVMTASGSSNVGGGSGTGSAGSSTTSGYSSYPTGYGSTGRGGSSGTKAASAFGGPYAFSCGSLSAAGGSSSRNNGEPIWYMCDDDKIKAMTQREFEELLSPARKITVTPYLLFYARFDLQTSTPPSAKSSTSNAAQQPSLWSNENITTQHPGTTAAALHKM